MKSGPILSVQLYQFDYCNHPYNYYPEQNMAGMEGFGKT